MSRAFYQKDGKLYELDEVHVPKEGNGPLQPLTFTGAVEASYDGTKAVSVEIPEGGGGLPLMTVTDLGGQSNHTANEIKAHIKAGGSVEFAMGFHGGIYRKGYLVGYDDFKVIAQDFLPGTDPTPSEVRTWSIDNSKIVTETVYELGGGAVPIATAETVGGFKAAEKTSEQTIPVGIDPKTGRAYVEPSGATGPIPNGSVTPAKTDFVEVKQGGSFTTANMVSAGYRQYVTAEYFDVNGPQISFRRRGIGGDPWIYQDVYDADKNLISDGLAPESDVHYIAYTVGEESTTTFEWTVDLKKIREIPGAKFYKIRVKNFAESKESSLTILIGDHEGPDLLEATDKYENRLVPPHSIDMEDTDFLVYRNPSIIDTSVTHIAGETPGMQLYKYRLACMSYADVSENKTVYLRCGYDYPSPPDVVVACYDADKNLLSSDGSQSRRTKYLEETGPFVNDYGVRIRAIVYSFTFDKEVKFARFYNLYSCESAIPYLCATYTPVTDLQSRSDKLEKSYSPEFVAAVEGLIKPEITKTMVMIGDSLTDWGGGNDTDSGFLKIVHDRTGVSTVNQGTAGAWWQRGPDTGGSSGVERVDAIVSGGAKYDLYCFMLGTNAGSDTDTGETSANPETMCGAVRYCMEKLKAFDPAGRILVCLPPQRAENNELQWKVDQTIKSIVESYSVKTLDIYHNSGIVPDSVVPGAGYLSDGLHFSDIGSQVMGDTLAAEAKYLLCL